MARRYLTVSIPYVNAAPHVGYALELVLADVRARAGRDRGDDVRFLGGTDDHALKNVLAAEASGQETQAFVDANAARFEALAGPLRISFDDFIRTSTDPRHRPTVERLWRANAARGDLYRRQYTGNYCNGCEQFYATADLVDGRCPEHQRPTELVAEENWFFRLSRYQDEIEARITDGRLRIEPEPYRRDVLQFVRDGLDDISVSRPTSRARGWGVPVPDDPDHVVYVWWDALANYISALGFGTNSDDYQQWWVEADERTHVIGKGILRFHAVYWPALLLSVGEPLPTTIVVHPYLTADGQKISKSSGNTVDPVAVVDEYGVDALRWWLAAAVPVATDADFTITDVIERHDRDLANGVGNLASRVLTMVHRAGHRVARDAPTPSLSAEPHGLVRAIDNEVAAANRVIETTRPWALTGSERDDVLNSLVASLHRIRAGLRPVVPDAAARLAAALSPDADGHVAAPGPLVPRLAPRCRA